MSPETLVAADAFQHFHPGARGCSGVLLLTVLLVSTVTDLRERRIKNSVTYPAAIIGLILNLLLSSCSLLPVSTHSSCQAVLGGVGFSQSIFGGLMCFGVICAQFLVAGTGGGDVKLQTVLGTLLGWQTGLEIWLLTMVMSGVFAAGLLLVRIGREKAGWLAMRILGFQLGSAELLHNDVRQQLSRRLPLAPFFLLGTTISLTVPLLNHGQRCFSILFALP
jgi:prepilin peptidase CpaA